jgi:thioesterase domain-containing protein
MESGKDQLPFFCVHGFGGGVVGYASLAHRMSGDIPFYGLQSDGFDGEMQINRSVEELAAYFIRMVRSVQAKGPYALGGYCFGGVVAFEMARQLVISGEAVRLVAIMEGYAPVRFRERTPLFHPRRLLVIWRNLPYWIVEYRQLGGQGISNRIRFATNRAIKKLIRVSGESGLPEPQDVLGDDLRGVPDHTLELMRQHLRALRAYNPQPYPGRVVVFSARGKTIRNVLTSDLDQQNGWGSLAQGGVEVRLVDGGHRNIHMEPYVASLANELRSCLQEAASSLLVDP